MNQYKPVTISLINYNGRKFVFQAIESAVNQNYPNLEIILIDNASTDGTREEIEKKIPEWEERRKNKCELHKGSTASFRYRSTSDYGASENRRQDGVEFIKYIKNTENAGFGKPHNEAMRIMKGDFILLLNYDAILKSDYIQNALEIFKDEKVGAVQGKLLRYDFDKNELYKNKENPELNTVDTTGLRMLKNRRIVCIGQGEADKGQFEKEKEIFGADGAVPVYRKEMLEDVKLPKIIRKSTESKVYKACPREASGVESQKFKCKSSVTGFHSPKGTMEPTKTDDAFQVPSSKFQDFEYFDENFFMYKEDVDLAWRMRLAGWKTIYTPKAVAYHGRGSGDSMAKNYVDIIKERRKINNFAKYLSFKHQRLMQIKNDFPSLLFTKHLPQFIVKEVGAWIYMAIFERFTFRILKDLRQDIPLFLKKRKIVMARKRVGAKEMERWFK